MWMCDQYCLLGIEPQDVQKLVQHVLVLSLLALCQVLPEKAQAVRSKDQQAQGMWKSSRPCLYVCKRTCCGCGWCCYWLQVAIGFV